MRVLIVGDSQAAGPPGQKLQALLQAQGHTVARVGHTGHGAYDWVRMHWDEYRALLASGRPDRVVLIFGSNDPPDERLAAALRQFKASHGDVWYAGPPRYDSVPRSQELSAGIRRVASSTFGSKHLDAWPATGASTPRASDGLHFTSSGGDIWAQSMMRGLSRAGSLGLPAWVAPAAFGGAVLFAVGAFFYSRQ